MLTPPEASVTPDCSGEDQHHDPCPLPSQFRADLNDWLCDRHLRLALLRPRT